MSIRIVRQRRCSAIRIVPGYSRFLERTCCTDIGSDDGQDGKDTGAGEKFDFRSRTPGSAGPSVEQRAHNFRNVGMDNQARRHIGSELPVFENRSPALNRIGTSPARGPPLPNTQAGGMMRSCRKNAGFVSALIPLYFRILRNLESGRSQETVTCRCDSNPLETGALKMYLVDHAEGGRAYPLTGKCGRAL